MDDMDQQDDEPRDDHEPYDDEAKLPIAVRYAYWVVAVSELGGFATAIGAAARMESVLNGMAAKGWELVVSTERSARWIGGETVLLTFRREITTEAMFRDRFFVEEKLRREVIDFLDQDDSIG